MGVGGDEAGGAEHGGKVEADRVERMREPAVALEDDWSSERARLGARADGFGNGSGGRGRRGYVRPLASDQRCTSQSRR